MYHRVIIAATVVRNAEMRFTAGGTGVTNVNLVVDEFIKGEKNPIWIRGTAWGDKFAEMVAKFARKGAKVLVDGTFVHESGNPRVWTGNDGVAKAAYEIKIDTFRVLKYADDDGAPRGETGSAPSGKPEAKPEIPF